VRLTEVAQSLWTLSVPHRMRDLGLEIGARMNVVRLTDGELVVLSPVPPDDALVDEVRSLGTVRALVAPNLHHHLYVGEWRTHFPDATLYVPRELPKKRPDLVPSIALGIGPAPGEPDDIRHLEIAGCERYLGENVFVHLPSGTLLVSDLVHNLPSSPHLFTRIYGTLMGFDGRVALSRAIRFAFRDRAAARRSLDALFELPWTRILPAHGEPIGGEAKQALRDAYTWL
jgi:hypothetical protein